MGRHATGWLMLAAMAFGLAACVGNQKEPEANIPPINSKQDILDTLTHSLEDPTNVHDAYISDPVLQKVGTEQRYAACVRFNARDVNHDYIGSKDHIAYFYGGRVNQLVEADNGQCAKAAYRPFPELEKLCFAKKCG